MTQPIPTITPQTLATWLADGEEIALVDVREEGLFGQGHALLASNVPYSRLELDVRARVPRPDTRTVLIGEERAGAASTGERAAERLAALGYTQVHVLGGGSAAWAAAGHRLFESIHVPSKAFAEVVEHAFHTPAITAQELQSLRDAGADLVILDGRTTAEYERFHVPGAISCPNAELVLRLRDLVPSPATRVVVSCAGRTRGIIGAQALINAGVPNPVAALEGGTQGWKLAGLPVEKGLSAVYGTLSDAALAAGTERARDLACRFEVPEIDLAKLQHWQADGARTTYLFDVRSPAEYAAGHLPGAVSVPGGQLVQTLDKWAATRGARLVLADDLGARAQVTAHWLRLLGWDASVLRFTPTDTTAAATTQSPIGTPIETSADIDPITPQRAATLLAAGALALSTDDSARYRQAHPAGALWANRSRLDELPATWQQAAVLLVFGHDTGVARLVAADLARAHPSAQVHVVAGGVPEWQAAGLALEATPGTPSDAERVDFLFWLHDRHTGNAEASRAYLAWEGSLPSAIGSPTQAGFRLPDSFPALTEHTHH